VLHTGPARIPFVRACSCASDLYVVGSRRVTAGLGGANW
jgi:hypothetical protein